jgi:hypothetical protein
MERRLRIFEMSEDADPIAPAESRLLREPFPQSYAATRARPAIDLRSGRCDDVSLWALEMLPVGQLVSGFLDFPSCFAGFLGCRRVLRLRPTPADGARECREVRPTHASGLRACARGTTARAGAGGSQEGARRAAAGAPGAEERGVLAVRAVGTLLARDGGVLVIRRGRGEQVLPDRWEPAPPSPEPAPVAGAPSPGADTEASATRQSTMEAARAAEAPARGAEPARVAEVVGGATAAAPAAPTTSAGTLRKRKKASPP